VFIIQILALDRFNRLSSSRGYVFSFIELNVLFTMQSRPDEKGIPDFNGT